jgi:Na+/melibiose symporter-like transporter
MDASDIAMLEIVLAVVISLTFLNAVIVALNYKLYTEMFKQIAQTKRKEEP